jgi:nucleoside-diphosphate-sugar epimerase
MTTVREPHEALRAALRPDDRIVITGASGWLGQSLLHELVLADPTLFPKRVLALGSYARKIELLDGVRVQVEEWHEATATEWQPTVAVHLACLTADRLASSTVEAYVETNARLAERGRGLQSIPSLRAFMFASSGAATLAGEESAWGRHPYARQKAEDETRYIHGGMSTGTPTLTARIWSVSGPYCTRPRTYAFSDMVVQCLKGDPIQVTATGRVLRRYVDAGEFLAACLALNLEGHSGVVDSAGDLVEVRELAAAVAHELGGAVIAAPIDPDVEPNTYVGDPGGMTAVAETLDVDFTDLAGQIRRTSKGLRW